MATAQTTGSTRFPELKPEQMTETQKRVYEGIVGGPRGARGGDVRRRRRVMDLVGVSGYDTLVSMVLNVAEVQLPSGVASPW